MRGSVSPRRLPRLGLVLLTVSVVLLSSAPVPSARGASIPSAYAPLPIEYGRQLLGNVSGPTLVPGASGTVSFTVADPLSSPIASTVVELAVYAFNAFPGNATSTVPLSAPPVLSNGSASGEDVDVALGTVGPGAVTYGSVGVATSASTPSGTFAVRTAVSFVAGGVSYRLESRGWFTAAAWASATELPNGSVTLNLTRLGVSGVTPETSVYIGSTGFDWAIGALAAGGVVLVGAGAWVYFRRAPGSSSGTR